MHACNTTTKPASSCLHRQNNPSCTPPAVTSGLEGVDAFERLKQEAAKASLARPPKALELPMPKIPDPDVARAALEVTAREGLPVKGTNAKGWEELRPKIVHDAKPNKVSIGYCQGVVCNCRRGSVHRANEFQPKGGANT